MITILNGSYMGISTGTKKNGNPWYAVKLRDNEMQEFQIFLQKQDEVEKYSKLTLGEVIDIQVNLIKKLNYQTQRYEISITTYED